MVLIVALLHRAIIEEDVLVKPPSLPHLSQSSSLCPTCFPTWRTSVAWLPLTEPASMSIGKGELSFPSSTHTHSLLACYFCHLGPCTVYLFNILACFLMCSIFTVEETGWCRMENLSWTFCLASEQNMVILTHQGWSMFITVVNIPAKSRGQIAKFTLSILLL